MGEYEKYLDPFIKKNSPYFDSAAIMPFILHKRKAWMCIQMKTIIDVLTVLLLETKPFIEMKWATSNHLWYLKASCFRENDLTNSLHVRLTSAFAKSCRWITWNALHMSLLSWIQIELFISVIELFHRELEHWFHDRGFVLSWTYEPVNGYLWLHKSPHLVKIDMKTSYFANHKLILINCG